MLQLLIVLDNYYIYYNKLLKNYQQTTLRPLFLKYFFDSLSYTIQIFVEKNIAFLKIYLMNQLFLNNNYYYKMNKKDLSLYLYK